MRNRRLYLAPLVTVTALLMTTRLNAANPPTTTRASGQGQELTFYDDRVMFAPGPLLPATLSRDNKFLLRMRLLGGPLLDLDDLGRIVQAIPKGILSKDIRRQLTSAKRVTSLSPSGRGSQRDINYSVAVVGPTRERTKELARALIVVCDHWLKKNRRKFLKEEIDYLKERLAELRLKPKRYHEALAVLKQYDKLLADLPSDVIASVPQSIIDHMRAKQYVLGVDIAGTRARIDAAKTLLRTGVRESQQELLGNVIVESQIDLTVMLERKKHVLKLMTAMERVNEYHDADLAGWKRRSLLSIRELRKAIDSGRYVPLKVLGKIRIHPIVWED